MFDEDDNPHDQHAGFVGEIPPPPPPPPNMLNSPSNFRSATLPFTEITTSSETAGNDFHSHTLPLSSVSRHPVNTGMTITDELNSQFFNSSSQPQSRSPSYLDAEETNTPLAMQDSVSFHQSIMSSPSTMPVVEQEERYEEEFPTFEKSFNNQIEDQSKHESFSQMHDSFPPQSPEMQEQFDKLSIHANTSRNDSFHASSKLPLHSASSSITKKSSPGEASSSTSQNFFKEDLVDTDYENLNFVRDFLDKKQNYLLKKSASERSQHEQTLAVAKKDLEDFYTDHNKKIAHKLKENQEREVAFQKQKQYVEASLTKPCDLNPVFSMYNWKNIHQKMGAIQATSRTAQMSGGGEASLKEIEDGVRRAALFS